METKFPSIWKLWEGNMEGNLFTGYSKEYANKGSRKEHFCT